MTGPIPAQPSSATVDETRYGPGPWVGEPDRLEWRYHGVPCLMVRNVEMGNWCGYAAVPPGHPWHGKDMNALEAVDAHGGLTYANKCGGHICHLPEPGESDDVWWLGFDFAHWQDVMPFTLKMRGAFSLDVAADADVTYKDVAYVRAECERLADQVLAAQP